MGKKGVVESSGRKTWDIGEYEKKLRSGVISDGTRRPVTLAVVDKKALKARDSSLELDSAVGSKALVSLGAPPEEQDGAGWYCKLCDRQLKDNKSWLDHLNSAQHQHNIGNELKVERSNLIQVKARIEFHRKRILEEAKTVKPDAATRLKVSEASYEEKRREKLEKKKQHKLELQKKPLVDAEMAAMGFNFTFGCSKKQR